MLVHQPNDYAVIYIDMDSFFASAEQQRRPELRGQTVGVSPYGGDGGCVVAASREAKRLGVRSGMRGQEARRCAPDIIFVRDTPHYYRLLHGKLLRILEDTPCRVCVRGIDEMRLEVPSYMRSATNTEQIVQDLRCRLRTELGECLTASFGVAANQWQAKLAASARKPDGFCSLRQSDWADFYQSLSLLDCTGINWRLQRRLFRIGVYNTSQLYRASESFLRQHFGVNGTKWYLRMRGYEVDSYAVKPKESIGHQTTIMPRPAEGLEEVKSVLTKMALKVGYRLRSSRRLASGLVIDLRFANGEGWSNIHRHMTPFSSQAAFVGHIHGLMSSLPSSIEPVKRVKLVSFGLHQSQQLSWLASKQEERDRSLSEATDSLRQRFGSQAIQYASSISQDLFPDRIGFGAPEQLSIPGAS